MTTKFEYTLLVTYSGQTTVTVTAENLDEAISLAWDEIYENHDNLDCRFSVESKEAIDPEE